MMADRREDSEQPMPGLLPLLTTAIDAIGASPFAREELLANICIEEKVFEREPPLATGGSFHVVRSQPDTLLKYIDSKFKVDMIHRFVLLQHNNVILRTPKTAVDGRSVPGQKVLDSISAEIAILQSDHLQKHENIINMLGICWEICNGRDRSVMPVLVLETAEGGDLSTYLQNTAEINARDRLRLSVHCFQGLHAVHNVGVIHADMKPENILVYIDNEGRPNAKLADFGCSLLESELEGRTKLDSGTPLWQSPKASEFLGPQELRQADIYSLSLVASLLLIGHPMYAVLEQVQKSGDGGMSLHDLKTEDGALASLIIRMQEEAESCGSALFTGDLSTLISFFFRLMLSDEEGVQEAGAMLPLKLLRTMLHREITFTAQDNVQVFETLDRLEKDVYLCPSKPPVISIPRLRGFIGGGCV
ncbi:kinase-like domain-containing protein [Rhexocercosporidium sp. MPI-PUGE-AT-0058]|nr:kinase-like domain-containing protein [Rhexocercosporidium sp. MPI-PUGE-AT-0058]